MAYCYLKFLYLLQKLDFEALIELQTPITKKNQSSFVPVDTFAQ